MDLINLNSFLRFGYFLKYRNPNYSIYFPRQLDYRYFDAGEEELIKIGSEIFTNAINKQFNSSLKNLVPLSGGLDSRAILAQLLKNTDATNIYTYTFGIPGTLDYDIGNHIAKKLGTNHLQINLKNYKYSVDELLDISKRIDHQTVLFYHPPVWQLDKIYSDFNIWSGSIIDVYYGRHYHKKKADNLDEAKNNFIRENIYTNQRITNIKDEEYFKYIDFDTLASDEINFEHHLDLLNRQIKYIAPHVLIKGFKYNVLINDSDLVKFSYQIDFKYIENQYLYKKIFCNTYPELFNIRTKSNFGSPLFANKFLVKKNIFKSKVLQKLNDKFPVFIDPRVNYRDFKWEIRNNTTFRNLIQDQILDLKKRSIIDWIDFNKLISDHLNNRCDYSKELLSLASLEIHLKAGKNI